MITQKKLKLILLWLLFSLFNLSTFSQNLFTNPIVIPPSPSVASFQQFDFSKVNLYNGLPSVNIPVYELELNNFKLPISLNYSYDGFKVDNVAGWLGLGWNIDAGGMISCIVHGKADECMDGYNNVRKLLNIPDPINNQSGYIAFISSLTNDQKRKFADGHWDGIPDDYIIKANNLSGSIIKLSNEKYVTIPYKPYIITRAQNSWEVSDEFGNLYKFGQLEGEANNNGLERTITDYMNGLSDTEQDYMSNWFLRKIVTNTGDTIHFNYTAETIERLPITNVTRFELLDKSNECPKLYESIGVTGYGTTFTWRLSTIECRKCSIHFYSNTLRKDIIPGSSSCSLGSIVIKDYAGQQLKKLVFDYDYLGDVTNYDKCRLILKKITEFGQDDVLKKPPHIFDYDASSDVPSYSSKAQDFWGYNNGKANTSLIPATIPNSYHNDFFSDCGDRNPDPTYSKLGLLTGVTLPTNGNISYLYEPNDYGFVNNDINPSELIPLSRPTVSAGIVATSTTNTDTKYFDISVAQSVDISYSFNNNGYPNENGIVSITDNTGAEIFTKSGVKLSGSEKIILSAGRYKLTASVEALRYSAKISVVSTIYKTDEQGNLVNNKNLITGGFRIKKTIQFDGIDHNNDKISIYSYNMPDEPDHSSGVLINSPSYEYPYSQAEIIQLSMGPASGSFCSYYVRSSTSNRPIYGNDGHIGYRFVRESNGESGENGSTLYNFTTSFDYGDITMYKSQPINKAYLRALTKSIIKFDKTGKTLYSKENKYNNPSATPNRTGIVGVFLVEYDENNIQDHMDTFKVPYFGIIASEWCYLTESKETYYFDSGNTTDLIKYFYENPVHAQLTKTVEQRSDGNTIETMFSYPSDNPTNIQTSGAVLNSLIQKNMQVKLKTEKSIQTNITEGQVTNYGLNLLPSSVYNLEGGIYKPRISFDSYGSYGNFLQFHQEDNINSSYIWGYNQTYPVVKGDNVTYDILNAAVIAAGATNLETFFSGFNNIANDAAQQTAWKNFNTALRSNASLANSQVTTYTYSPLVGMTSQTDPNGITTYFKYDSFGRLENIKDKDQNILKSNQYHYYNN